MITRPAPLLTRVAARWMLAPVFVIAGSEAFTEPGARVAKAEDLGVPGPALATRANGAAMVAGGISLALGYKSRLAALGLIASLIPTTLAGHPFWNETDPAKIAAQRVQFLKNLGLMGGLLLVATERR